MNLATVSYKLMRSSHYLFGIKDSDLSKNTTFIEGLKVVGPVIRALPPNSDLAKVISVSSKLRQHAAAEALGSLYYGSSIRTILDQYPPR
eukprot:2428759-Amphidinium_carterae.3